MRVANAHEGGSVRDGSGKPANEVRTCSVQPGPPQRDTPNKKRSHTGRDLFCKYFMCLLAENFRAVCLPVFFHIAKCPEVDSNRDAAKPVPVIGFAVAALVFVIGVVMAIP